MKLPNVTINYSCFNNPEWLKARDNIIAGLSAVDKSIPYYVEGTARAEVLTWNINKGSMRVRLIESAEYPIYKKEMGKITTDLTDKALLEEYPELANMFAD